MPENIILSVSRMLKMISCSSRRPDEDSGAGLPGEAVHLVEFPDLALIDRDAGALVLSLHTPGNERSVGGLTPGQTQGDTCLLLASGDQVQDSPVLPPGVEGQAAVSGFHQDCLQAGWDSLGPTEAGHMGGSVPAVFVGVFPMLRLYAGSDPG